MLRFYYLAVLSLALHCGVPAGGLGITQDASDKGSYAWTNIPVQGYKARHNVLMWRMIHDDLEALNFTRDASPCCLDWGSDAGYFSSVSAVHFRGSKVVSFDMHTATQTGRVPPSKRVSQSRTAMSRHMRTLHEYKIKNNQICDTQFSPATFRALGEADIVVDIQLTLNILHWMDSVETSEQFDQMLFDHLRLSLITYVMIPVGLQPRSKNPRRVKDWLNGRTVAEVVEQLAAAHSVQFKVKLIEIPSSMRRFSVTKDFVDRPMYRIIYDNPSRPQGMEQAKQGRSDATDFCSLEHILNAAQCERVGSLEGVQRRGRSGTGEQSEGRVQVDM